MKFFKSYTGGMVVLAIAIVLSILGGSHRSLAAERSRVEAAFYSGADGSGYSIAADLADCLDISANLLTVAGRYLDGADLEQLRGSWNQLEAALDKRTHYYSIGNAYDGYQRLAEAAEAVLDALDGEDLTERDARYVQGFRTDLAARADTIARDGYNDQADAFNQRVLGRFPANLLGRITFVRPAQVFR